MADIFLSYTRADQVHITKLAAMLEDAGYSVWWDRNIDGGAEFAEYIERELAEASAVLVAWSADSIRSRWVRDEASIALEDSKLVSISLDGTAPPIGFKQIHAIDMRAGTGKADLLRTLARKIGVQQTRPSSAATRSAFKLKMRAWAAGLFAAVLLILGASAMWPDVFDNKAQVDPEAVRMDLAVLPFNISADPDLEDMNAAFPASLANSLGGVENVSVASFTATQSALTGTPSFAELGKTLGVTHLIEGEISSASDKLYGNLNLIETSSGRSVWSRKVEGEKTRTAHFRRDILNRLTAMIGARIAFQRGDFELPTGIPRAKDAFLQGYEALHLREEPVMPSEALRQFETASAIDPNYADAHAGRAYILSDSTPRELSMTREELEREQRVAAARAHELDPDNLLATIAKANATLMIEGDIGSTLRMVDELMAKEPRNILVQQLAANARVLAGQPREALVQSEQAIAIDPMNSASYLPHLKALFLLGDYAALSKDARGCPPPCSLLAWGWHAALMRTGSEANYRADIDKIVAMADADREGIPSDEMDVIARKFILGEEGDIRAEDGIAEGFPYAQVLAHFGRVDDAFRVANRNIDDQPTTEIFWLLDGSRMTIPRAIRADPRYHAIFQIPRFRAIAAYRRKHGLTDGLPVFPAKPYRGE